MSNHYINPNIFLCEFIESKRTGFINYNLDIILNKMIENNLKITTLERKYFYSFSWFIRNKLDESWLNYDFNLNKNPYSYYNNVIKRIIEQNYLNIRYISEIYYNEFIVGQRQIKIEKIRNRIK